MPVTTRANFIPPTKTVTIYRNGDAFYPGRRVVVNPRQMHNLDDLLSSVTGGLGAPYGAVRRLFTPTEGHRVRRLEDVQHGGVYVAAGNEAFKNLNYSDITTKKPQKKKTKPIQPVCRTKILIPARCFTTEDGSCTINVFTNGIILAPAAKIRIPKYTLRSWEKVLAMVTEKVRLCSGAVHRLYTFDGLPVSGPAELKNNQYYVAVGAEKFKALPYEQTIPCMYLIRHHNLTQGHDTRPANRKTRQANDVFARTVLREDLEHTARGHMKKHAAEPGRTQQQTQVSRNPVLFSAGEGSVFNARNIRSEMARAAEVQEDSDVKVDLPIDQVEAETVEEEDENCCASPCKASLHDSDGLCLQRSLSAVSRKDHSFSSREGEALTEAQSSPAKTQD